MHGMEIVINEHRAPHKTLLPDGHGFPALDRDSIQTAFVPHGDHGIRRIRKKTVHLVMRPQVDVIADDQFPRPGVLKLGTQNNPFPENDPFAVPQREKELKNNAEISGDQNFHNIWWGLSDEIRTGNQKVGKEKDGCR